jgi:hypothetical protein
MPSLLAVSSTEADATLAMLARLAFDPHLPPRAADRARAAWFGAIDRGEGEAAAGRAAREAIDLAFAEPDCPHVVP